jgi:tetratricopeptide (TPR) repeat protein
MAPEQIAEMIQSRDRQANRTSSDTPRVSLVNEQSDLFAVGVMLFELLTGQLPFQSSPANADPYDFALAQRRGPRPSARAINPDVPVEVDAIVRSLLAPDRGDRYRSATALREDLLNHLEHRPLRHVRGTSLAGRVVKWHKRHPRAAIKAIAATAAVAAIAFGAWGYSASERKADLTAIQDVARARTELAKLQIDLAAPSETDSSRRGIVAARALFERFGISMGSDALDAHSLVRLPADERARFLDELHDVAMLAAYADGVRGADRRTETHVANWQKLAAACGTMPADSTVRGAMLAGVRAIHDGRMTDASRQLEKVVASQPSNASGQFLFGIALLEQFQYRRAEERFAMAAALDPTDARAPYNRGLVLFYERKLGPALEAFSQALDRDPSMPDARLQRSLARFLMKDYDGSMEDALTAVKAESVAYRALALIAQIHDARGETDQAAAAHKKLASATPRTSADYFARGRMNVAEKKFTQALLDFRTATTLNPRYAAAWNNQAHVLGECLHETDQAIAAMDRAVEVNPQNGELYLGRAVLLARIGKRDAAHADVEKGRLLTDQPIPLYQAACVFSLTSRTHTADAAKAVAALCDAVKAGFRQPKTFATDPDLESIRHLPEAKRIIDAAGSLVN